MHNSPEAVGVSTYTAADLVAEQHATLTLPQLADLLMRSRNAIYQDARTGTIAGMKVIKIGNAYRVATADVRRLLGVAGWEES